MIIVIGIFALFYLLLGLWIAIQILKGKRLRWPIGRNEGRKMFDGWIATREQVMNGGLEEANGLARKKHHPIWRLYINDMILWNNAQPKTNPSMAFDKYGQEIH